MFAHITNKKKMLFLERSERGFLQDVYSMTG